MQLRIPKLRPMRIKLYVIIVLILISYIIFSFFIVDKLYLRKSDRNIIGDPGASVFNIEYIVVHLDLKGAPPKLSYLESTFHLLKEHGVNGLLIEYEDMFPFEGKLVNISARNAYDREELYKFLTLAVKSGFEIIPLIQTFGHLEFALKLSEFMHLREEPIFPDSICPSKNASKEFVMEMLKQVITFHQQIAPLRYFHIGCDEVYHLNQCNDCFHRNLSNVGIFLSHVKFVTEAVLRLSPDTTVLVWDDMFRRIKPYEYPDLRCPDNEPVYWDYSGRNLESNHPLLYKYHKMFTNTWIATAFKGADGPTETFPNLTKRFWNHFYSMEFNLRYGVINKMYNFKGIILTGWSRYSHMDPLCELFPVSIPSLILNLILIEKYQNGIAAGSSRNIESFLKRHIEKDFNSALTCRDSLDGSLDRFEVSTCLYDGSDLYSILKRCMQYEMAYTERFFIGHDRNQRESYVAVKDLRMGYINMYTVKTLMDWCINSMQELTVMESEIVNAMTVYFDKYAIDEYVVFKVSRMKKDISELWHNLSEYYVVKEWPRRPAIISIEWQEPQELNYTIV